MDIPRSGIYALLKLALKLWRQPAATALLCREVCASGLFPRLGAIIASSRAGRVSEMQIRIAHLTATANQNSAVSSFAFARADAAAAGTALES